MNRNLSIFSFLVLALAAAGCSGTPPATPKRPLDKIQGKAQVLEEQGGASDQALNAGGPSVYIWEGVRRYRLFLRTSAEIVHGKEYVVEGINAQKLIDELGDPDQGKNGYPLQSSCERTVTMAWSNVSFDSIASTASLVRTRVKRYPARPLFLVSKIQPAEGAASGSGTEGPAEDEKVPEISVPAEKQRAALIEAPQVPTAPLWEPAGGTVRCKVVINPQGKISELETGEQLCEAVDWSQYHYQPPVQRNHPVKVSTEVEVRFEARK